jgi:hypothetical protein
MPMDRPESGTNQRRVEEAFRLLGMAAVRMVSNSGRTAFVVDLASRDGVLQDVWCRDEISAEVLTGLPREEASDIALGVFGGVNAERYVRCQKSLSELLVELTRSAFTGSASLRLRGSGGEIADEIRGESRRQWRF